MLTWMLAWMLTWTRGALAASAGWRDVFVGGTPLRIPESLSVALETVDLIERRPVVRAQCLEIALECAVSPNEDVRTRAVRLVSQRLHGVKTLAAGIEAFALHHLDEASAEGKERWRRRRDWRRRRAVRFHAPGEKVKGGEGTGDRGCEARGEAEERAYKPGGEDGPAGPAGKVGHRGGREEEGGGGGGGGGGGAERMTSVAVGDAVRCLREARRALLRAVQPPQRYGSCPGCSLSARCRRIFAPPWWRAWRSTRSSGTWVPACDALVAAIAAPQRRRDAGAQGGGGAGRTCRSTGAQAPALAAAAGSRREGQAAAEQAPAALIAAVEKLAAANSDGNPYLVPLLGSFDAKRVKALMPRLVGSAPRSSPAALDRLTASIPPKPLTAPEIIVALHDVDPRGRRAAETNHRRVRRLFRTTGCVSRRGARGRRCRRWSSSRRCRCSSCAR